MPKQINWISEAEAIKIAGYTSALHFRRLVKRGTFTVSYRTRPDGKFFEYDERQVRAIKDQYSIIIHT